jgi:hypothetical protein
VILVEAAQRCVNLHPENIGRPIPLVKGSGGARTLESARRNPLPAPLFVGISGVPWARSPRDLYLPQWESDAARHVQESVAGCILLIS